MTKQDFIVYIQNKIQKYPFLNSIEALNNICGEVVGFLETLGGLEDVLHALSLNKLRDLALTVEKYQNEKRHLRLIGGLEDYITTLTEAQLIDYIMQVVQKYPELNSYEKVESLRQKYGFSHFGGDNNMFLSLGGLHDYIYRTPKSTLIGWALASEEYSRGGQRVIGGLSDYVNSMTVEQLAEYILKQADRFPELNSAEKLDSLVKQYGFGQ